MNSRLTEGRLSAALVGFPADGAGGDPVQVQLRLTIIGYEGAVYTGASKYRLKGSGVEYNSRSLTRSVGVSGTVEVSGRSFEVEVVEGQNAQVTSYRLERRPYVN